MGEHSIDCIKQSIKTEFARRVSEAVQASLLGLQPASPDPTSEYPLFDIAESIAHDLKAEHRQHFPGRWVPSVAVCLLPFPLLFGLGAIGLEIRFTHRAGSSLN